MSGIICFQWITNCRMLFHEDIQPWVADKDYEDWCVIPVKCHPKAVISLTWTISGGLGMKRLILGAALKSVEATYMQLTVVLLWTLRVHVIKIRLLWGETFSF